MNKQLKNLLQHRTRRRKGDKAELAAQLAPLEERKQVDARDQGLKMTDVNQQQGAIVVDNDSLPLPKEVMEGRGAGRLFLGMEPVVLVILIVMLTFIAFIAWQISLMPVE
jgi:hypothetical protein